MLATILLVRGLEPIQMMKEGKVQRKQTLHLGNSGLGPSLSFLILKRLKM
jgi:hypothetical protein